MKKMRYRDGQILRMLREPDKAAVAELAKRYGLSEASIDIWDKQCGSFEIEDKVKHLK